VGQNEWRPEDVKEKFPLSSANPYEFTKYDTEASKSLKAWSWFQFGVLLFMLFQLLFQIVEIGTPNVFIYGGFLFFMVYSYTTLMDRDPSAFLLENVKAIMGLLIIFNTGSWFKIDSVIPGGSYIIAAYLIISALVVAYFVYNDIGLDQAGAKPMQDTNLSGV